MSAPETHVLRLLVFSPFYPPHRGGLESHAEQFNKAMHLKGHVITVLTPRLPGLASSHEQQPGIDIYRFPAWQLIPNFPLPQVWHWGWWSALTRVLKQRPDIIISRTRFFPTSALAGVLAWWSHIPWLHIEHGSDYVHLSSSVIRRLARWYDQVVGRLVLRTATAVVANSRASAAFVQRLAPKQNVTVLYRGIDQKSLNAIHEHTTARQSAGTKCVIVYCGRLIAGKGVRTLIAAAKSLSVTDYQLWLVGGGPATAELRTFVQQLGLTKQVQFWGEQPWHEAMALLQAADIAVNPSYTEGLPTSVIEAAYFGKAIVATAVGGTTEIISPLAARFFSPGDEVTLSTHLQELITTPAERLRLGQQAQEAVKARFDWSKTAVEYNALLHGLVQSFTQR